MFRLISRCHSATVGFRREGQLAALCRKKRGHHSEKTSRNHTNNETERVTPVTPPRPSRLHALPRLEKLSDDKLVRIRGSRSRAVSLSRQDTSGEGRKKADRPTDCTVPVGYHSASEDLCPSYPLLQGHHLALSPTEGSRQRHRRGRRW